MASPDPTQESRRRAGPIRSYVRREGRLTGGQQRALQRLWARFGVEPAGGTLQLERLFGRNAPVTLEIGFGNGENLAHMAAEHPHMDFLGVEIHRPGVGQLLRLLEEGGLSNVRVMMEDAVVVLRDCIQDGSLTQVTLLFPDPWPKKRHHKRRLVQPGFVELLAQKLRPGGIIELATDWEDYAQHVLTVMASSQAFELTSCNHGVPRTPRRIQTKFERRGLRLGHQVHEFSFVRA